MITDGQVRKLHRLLSRGESLAAGARKTGMDEKTARKYRDSEGLPSKRKPRRTWRTRVDPFAEVWPEVQERLEAEPRLRAFTLFGWLQERYPGRFSESQRRTFERRVRDWRARHGPGREVMFPQVHQPGGLGASDFTNMNSLRVTIAGQPFDHLVYHFTRKRCQEPFLDELASFCGKRFLTPFPGHPKAFTVTVEYATSWKDDDEVLLHYWIRITSKRTGKSLYVDDGFFNGEFVHADRPTPYTYPPEGAGKRENECQPPAAFGPRAGADGSRRPTTFDERAEEFQKITGESIYGDSPRW